MTPFPSSEQVQISVIFLFYNIFVPGLTMRQSLDSLGKSLIWKALKGVLHSTTLLALNWNDLITVMIVLVEAPRITMEIDGNLQQQSDEKERNTMFFTTIVCLLRLIAMQV